jgi:transcriptional regulator with XRE-family HTH domain
MDEANERPRLGAALRGLRARHGWTLAYVSGRTGLSITTLSKVENDRISLSYDKLVRLSEGLEIDIEELFVLPGQNVGHSMVGGRRSINPAGGGTLVATRNYDYRYLSTDLVHKKFIPIETDIRARTLEEFGPLVKHTGEEFVYVLEGEIEVHTELYAPFILKAGESVYLDSSMGHAYLARSERLCRIIGVCSASEMQFCEPAPTRSVARKPATAARPRKRTRAKRAR